MPLTFFPDPKSVMLSSAVGGGSAPSPTAMSALLAASSSSSTSSESSTQQQQQLAAAAAAAAAQQQQQAAALAAMAATRSFLEKLSSSHGLHPPAQVELKEDKESGDLRVWAVENIPAGVRYGPFLGKWVQEPASHKYAWEVSGDTVFAISTTYSSIFM